MLLRLIDVAAISLCNQTVVESERRLSLLNASHFSLLLELEQKENQIFNIATDSDGQSPPARKENYDFVYPPKKINAQENKLQDKFIIDTTRIITESPMQSETIPILIIPASPIITIHQDTNIHPSVITNTIVLLTNEDSPESNSPQTLKSNSTPPIAIPTIQSPSAVSEFGSYTSSLTDSHNSPTLPRHPSDPLPRLQSQTSTLSLSDSSFEPLRKTDSTNFSFRSRSSSSIFSSIFNSLKQKPLATVSQGASMNSLYQPECLVLAPFGMKLLI